MADQKILYDASSILDAEVGITETDIINEKINELTSDVKPASKVKGEITLTRLDNEISALFNAKSVVKLICSRCLKKFNQEIVLNYEQIFSYQKNDDNFLIRPDKKIDIYPSLRQEILLNIPIKPLCNEKCKI